MKTIEEIKEDYAENMMYDSWGDLYEYEYSNGGEEVLMDKIAELYAQQFKDAFISEVDRHVEFLHSLRD